MSNLLSLYSRKRRDIVSGLTASALLHSVPSNAVSQTLSSGPRLGYRIPGEFEPSRVVWLSYDIGHKSLTAALVQVLSTHVRLKFLVSSKDDAMTLRDLLNERSLAITDIEIFIRSATKYFLRDVTSLAVAPRGALGAVSFRWSDYGLPGWCKRRYAAEPEQVNQCSGGSTRGRNEASQEVARLTQAELLATDLYIEGGALEVNGQGLIIANEALLKQRNPGLTRAQLERTLLGLPGVRKVIWLPQGLAEDPPGRATIVGNFVAWGTGGHTDEFVRFADASTVLLAWPDDAEAARHPVARLTRQRMQTNYDILSRATGMTGERLKVIRVPMPKLIERRVFLSAAADRAWSHEWTADFFAPNERRREGDPVMQIACASYLNFVIANGVVVVPEYTAHGTSNATQDRVRRIFEAVFKGKEIVFIDAITANWVGGGPHCATLKEPALYV